MTDAVTDETLSQFEIGAAPFTKAELAAIAAYREAISGIQDGLDEIDPRDLIRLGPPDAPGVRYLLARFGDGLNTWYLALDQALAEMLTCTTESTSYSKAASRFLQFESTVYHQVRAKFEYAVTVYMLGRHNTPTGDYPPNTITLNLPMQGFVGSDG